MFIGNGYLLKCTHKLYLYFHIARSPAILFQDVSNRENYT